MQWTTAAKVSDLAAFRISLFVIRDNPSNAESTQNYLSQMLHTSTGYERPTTRALNNHTNNLLRPLPNPLPSKLPAPPNRKGCDERH